MNNLRKFTTEADYSAATLSYPAVSWVTATDNVYFDKSAPTPTFSGLTVYYNIEDTSNPTTLFTGGSSGSGSGSGSGGVLPSAMIIDGTAVEVTSAYAFDTVGEHIVNYSFADNQIPNEFLSDSEVTGKFSTVRKVEIGDAITSIGYSAFNYCTNLTSIDIPSGVTSIGSYAFNNCRSLTSIDIPDSVTSIGGYAFDSCYNLTSVTISNSVTSIGDATFYGCTSLTSIVIPSGITSIEGFAFDGCNNLTSVTVEAVDPPSLGSDVFNDTNNCPIYVPSQSVDEYKNSTSTGWYEYASRIQAIP
jgi:hypothetical protein